MPHLLGEDIGSWEPTRHGSISRNCDSDSDRIQRYETGRKPPGARSPGSQTGRAWTGSSRLVGGVHRDCATLQEAQQLVYGTQRLWRGAPTALSASDRTPGEHARVGPAVLDRLISRSATPDLRRWSRGRLAAEAYRAKVPVPEAQPASTTKGKSALQCVASAVRLS